MFFARAVVDEGPGPLEFPDNLPFRAILQEIASDWRGGQ
jgi:hypothetical protein